MSFWSTRLNPLRNSTKKLRNDLAEKKVTGKEYQERLRAQHAKLASQNLGWANLDTIAQKKKKDERKKEKGLASDEEDVESEGENDAAVGAQEMLDGSFIVIGWPGRLLNTMLAFLRTIQRLFVLPRPCYKSVTEVHWSLE
jgi:hypothetical protein